MDICISIYVFKIVKTVYLPEEASAALIAMLKSGQRGSTIKVRIYRRSRCIHKLTIGLAREERKEDDHEAQGVYEGVRPGKV